VLGTKSGHNVQSKTESGEVRRSSGVCHGDSSRNSTARRPACAAQGRAPSHHRKLKGEGKESDRRGAYSEA
jgi:hypothetical protein